MQRKSIFTTASTYDSALINQINVEIGLMQI